MNKHQKLVQQQFLNNEEAVIKRLESVYAKSLSDVTGKIQKLEFDIEGLKQEYKWETDLDEKAKIQSKIQAKIYQKKYQEQLETQLSPILDNIQTKQYTSIASYLDECYSDGFIGTVFDLHGQDIPLIMPINQESMVRAVQLDSKISQGLYAKLGEDVTTLKKKIMAQTSRAIATGMTYAQTAQQLAGYTRIGYNNAIRIARTEGHRIQCQAGMDACYQAKDRGADVVKQWDSTLDDRTRESHAAVDGQIRELDKPFSNGLMFPGDPSGGAAEVVNCRCALLQRARWALDEDELAILQERAEHFGLDKSAEFEDFKQNYLKAVDSKPEPVKTKKEYLTEKKLKQNIDDADVEIDKLKKELADVNGWNSYDEFMKDFGTVDSAFGGYEEAHTILEAKKQMEALEKKYGGYSKMLKNGTKAENTQYAEAHKKLTKAEKTLKDKYQLNVSDFGTSDEIEEAYQNYKKSKAIQDKIEKAQSQVDEWQEKLDKKLTAKEIKKLKKEQILLQDELDGFDVKTYSGIWKDDVTTADWAKLNIEGKKKYYEGKFITETDPDKLNEFKELYKQLQELDDEGKKYFGVQQKLNKSKADLTKLQKNGKITQKNSAGDAFSQDRKDAAKWFDRKNGGFSKADAYFDPKAKTLHSAATRQERDGFYTYTSGSGGHNRPLAGFQKPYAEYGTGWEEKYFVGPKQVWIDFEGKGDQIRGLTTLIQKSTYDDDVWLQSGQGFATLEGVLQIPYGSLSRMSDADLQQFVGRRPVFQQFISTAVNEGGGSMFNSKPMKFNIYAPKGSQMLYASDCGAFGKGENEMILQRGGTYEITKIYWGNDATDGNKRKLFVDMDLHYEEGYDLFQQDPNEWTGSMKNYKS